MYRGTGKKGQAISGTAAMLSNIKKQGGWDKVKEGMVNAAALAAAKAAVDEHIRLSNQPVPAVGRPEESRSTRH